ncbi:MAG: VOC family protein [Rhodobacteraceae bacterium]|nr:VOC family protein [Paracoccaceae bacterium]
MTSTKLPERCRRPRLKPVMVHPRSPLAFAILGVSTLDRALAFYRDVIGLDASPEVRWRGAAFETHFDLPPGSSARAVMFSFDRGACKGVGRVLALEFDAKDRKTIPKKGDRTYRGLWNLNFYVDDIRATTKQLQAKGYDFWSEPVGYEVSAKAGAPVEVLFDGPDGLAINLVELTGGPDTTIGRLREKVAALGKTAKGFTPVSTTSHSIVDHGKALAFYRDVLGMEVVIDDVLDKPATNHFLNRPAGARTRATFVAGGHEFGKIALSHPLNYSVENKIPLAVPPNIGYLAQSFAVPSLDTAAVKCAEIGADPFSPPLDIEIPGVGCTRAMIVRNPGSGALMQMFEAVR